MPVTLVVCGPTANESEQKSFHHLKSRLQSEAPGQKWILLTNLAFSVTHDLQSDEIDLVAIGPTGIRVIEIKHWTAKWIADHSQTVEHEAEKLIRKVRKIGTTARNTVKEMPFVEAAFLLSQDAAAVKGMAGKAVRGVEFYTLKEWKEAIRFDAPNILSPQQVDLLATRLYPQSAPAIDGSLRRLAGYVNLELQTPKTESFHRIYKGSHPTRRDRVVLHLYDLSASDDKRAEEQAKREYEALRRLQLYPWAPRVLDSYQEAPGFAGEMYFFTLVDPAAPTLAERSDDTQWELESRIAFAKASLDALHKMHDADAEHSLIHRNIRPETILVRHDNAPIFTGFDHARIPLEASIGSSTPPTDADQSMAPEVRVHGRSAAEQASDVYSLCASLSLLFKLESAGLSQNALVSTVLAILRKGMIEEPKSRATLSLLSDELSVLLGESAPKPTAPPARYWTEDQEVTFQGSIYRIVSKLGSGGIGMTYKVLQLEHQTKQELGTYVAKVAHDHEKGEQTLTAYRLVRSHLGHTGLSTVFEVAGSWQENTFVALMKWIPGTPLLDYQGLFPLLAEDQQEPSGEVLALRWLHDSCTALRILHNNGLIHGDVSPRNLIVNESELVLTDYDFAQRIGERRRGPGTRLYCSPHNLPASPSDDIFALAASFFHVLFEQEPFLSSDLQHKTNGLNWDNVQKDDCPVLMDFLNKATDPNPDQRFTSVDEAMGFLESQQTLARQPQQTTPETNEGVPFEASRPSTSDEELFHHSGIPAISVVPVAKTTAPPDSPQTPLTERRPQRVPWLRSVLQSYPGSRWGNRETRGLDSDFAASTYVETALERILMQDISQRRVRLVVLCGNAGDGKTALLQHLAERLGLGQHKSSKRILEGQVPDGPFVRMNLDGSAAWQGRSADELLDEFLQPFMAGPPQEDLFHLLAINDGRLLEWLENTKMHHGQQHLFSVLYALLNREESSGGEGAYVRFISLNERSLVGGIMFPTPHEPGRIDTDFLARLTDRLYGGEQTAENWRPCLSCTAQDRCGVFQAAQILGPDSLPHTTQLEVRQHARQRLFQALQAVHLRGETHITVRELRAALVYILFGIYDCEDYHAGKVSELLPYWERAFAHDSPARQGDVLAELVRFDPALEAHPKIDRSLLQAIAGMQKATPEETRSRLASERRRAYFERLGQDADKLRLANGEHLQAFRDLPLLPQEERDCLRNRLCRGISHLEDLPAQAHDRPGVVPLRIIPRTPTETAFWVEKPLANFRLQADLPPETEGIEHLHRQASLIYTYASGQEEQLRMGAELFHLLLELADGYQLGDASNDDVFNNLSIFVQRLVREDERSLLAWTPIKDEQIYQVSTDIRQTEQGARQKMVIASLNSGGSDEHL